MQHHNVNLSTATDLELRSAETDTEDEVRSQFTGSIRTKQREQANLQKMQGPLT